MAQWIMIKQVNYYQFTKLKVDQYLDDKNSETALDY